MKNRKPFLSTKFILFLIIILMPTLMIAQVQQSKKIIYETDICADVDDVGGLAILNALANNGEVEILAVCFNEVHPSGAATIDAINTWYGRGDIPIGVYKGVLNNPDGSGYLDYVAKFPHDLENTNALSALDVYRQVLAQQPDSSVTIISVGFTNNLNDLLSAEPELVAKKVKELVQMAGVWNDGFNLVCHNLSSASINVIKNWPTPLVISQEGGSILTADNLKSAPEGNPVREAFYRYFGNEYNQRPSWDEMAVLYGVRGLGSNFNNISTGSGTVDGYTWQMMPGFRSYLSNRFSDATYVKIIEDLMDQLPIGAHFNVSDSCSRMPFLVNFDASPSIVAGNRTIKQYLWNFGDGTSGEGKLISHEYTTTGIFDVKLTIIDNFDDSLHTTDSIQVRDPIFSQIDYFGSACNYVKNQSNLWSTQIDSDNLRLHLSNEPRNPNISMPGFCFVKDSIYSDFTLRLKVRMAENLSQNSQADYSIIFGYVDKDNYNYLQMKHTTSTLVSVTNKQSISLSWTNQSGIIDENYHEVLLNLQGDNLKITIDDSVFLESTSFRLLQEGRIGFGSAKYSLFFDDVEILGHGSPTSISQNESLPKQFKVWQNFPNPFNPSTTIKFALHKPEIVKIEIYNIIGQKVETLLNKSMSAGYHEVEFNGENLISGVYIYNIEAGDFHAQKKMILMK